MLGPIGPPTPCDVLLATIRACTVRAICSALKRAEPDSRGGKEEEGGRRMERGGKREEGSRYAMAEDERGEKKEEMRKGGRGVQRSGGEEKGTTSRHKS